EDDIERVLVFEVVHAAKLDAHVGEGGEVPPRCAQRRFVDVDRRTTGRTQAHGPVAVATRATSYVQERTAAPIGVGIEEARPATELLELLRRQIGEPGPGITEAIR